MRMFRIRVPSCGLAALIISIAPLSWAEGPTAEERALAEALFRDAQALVQQERLHEACPKFQESHRLDPKPGTILNLAVCHEKQGKTASAWLDYKEAAALAARTGRKDREQFAKERVAALEKELAWLTVRVPEPVPGLVVKLDAAVLTNAAWGTAAPIDPGTHAVEAIASGYRTWSTSMVIKNGPKRLEVVVPKLEPAPAETSKPLESGAMPPPQVVPEKPNRPLAEGPNKLVWIGAGLGAAGVAGIVMGSVFGARTFDLRDAGDAECSPPPNDLYCTRKGIELHSDAQTSATLSTVGFVVGPLGLAAGATLLIWGLRSAPPAPRQAWVLPYAGPSGAGFSAGWSF